jgi:2-phospho-L-lactate guanylyltransferase (CobY/MobA/RfbA family)
MPNSQQSQGVIATLADSPPEVQVSVLVRPAGQGGVAAVRTLDPKQFSSAIDYRSALIAQQKEATRPGKDAVVVQAHNLGLDASAASTLNAVLVHGSAGSVLQLLDQIPYESVNFDSVL